MSFMDLLLITLAPIAGVALAALGVVAAVAAVMRVTMYQLFLINAALMALAFVGIGSGWAFFSCIGAAWCAYGERSCG